MRRTWIAAIAVLAIAAAAAGCGGSDNGAETNPTEAWASGFCSAVTDWTDSLTNISDQFKDPSNLSQDGLQSAANDLRTATDTFVSDLKDLGKPETESGTEVEDAIDSLSSTLDSESSAIEDTADGVSSLAELPGAISKIATSLSAISTSVSSALQTIDNADATGELKTALENSPECEAVSS